MENFISYLIRSKINDIFVKSIVTTNHEIYFLSIKEE